MRSANISVLLFMTLSCVRPAQVPVEPPTREEVLLRAVDEEEAKHIYKARYNPPLCPCPAFEVDVGGNWMRVALVAQDEDLPILQDLSRFVEDRADTGEETLYLIGALESDRVQYSATGFPVMEFVLEGFTDKFPEPPMEGNEKGEAL